MSSPIKFIEPDWPISHLVKAYTTVRDSWGINEISLKNLLSLPASPIWLKQVHGTKLIEARPENTLSEADASFSRQVNQVCVVLTADCLPILLYHRSACVVSAIHAGWRGLSLGIIEQTLDQLSLPPADWMVWLGPAISAAHFEVGRDVYDIFVNQESDLAACFTPISSTKWLGNLYKIAAFKLKKLGIQHIHGGEYCTYRQSNLFYSYRREPNCQGRMASVIWMTNQD